MPNGWIGVDLDGTFAHYGEWEGYEHIGTPVPKMLKRVKNMLARGVRVKILTARAAHGEAAKRPIREWLKKFGFPELEITNEKDFDMIGLYDDRVTQIIPNTGRRADGKPDPYDEGEE